MKKLMRMILVIILGSTLIGCQQKEKPSHDEGDVKAEVHKVMEIEKPKEIQDIRFLTYLNDGTLRIGGMDQTGENHSVWDSKNDGKDWIMPEDVNDFESADIQNVFYKYSSDKRFYVADGNEIRINGDGEQIKIGLEGKGIYLDSVLSENELYVLAEGDSGTKQIWKHDLSNGSWELLGNEELSKTIAKAKGFGCLAIDSSGENLYIEGEGIIKYNIEQDETTVYIASEEMGKYIDRISEPMTALAASEDTLAICTRNSDGTGSNLYLATEEQEGKADKKADKKESTDLEIYSLKENYMIRNSLASFRRVHTDIPITYTVGYTGGDGVSVSDAIRKLNTEIMAGEGPDIIVLDNLPAEQYMAKGILEPVTDVIEDKKEELFFNIVEGCNSGGEIYAVPTTFGIPIAAGNSSVLSLSNANEMIQQAAGESVPVMTAQNFPIAAINMFVTSDIVKENEIDRDKLREYYNNLIRMKELSNVIEKTEGYSDYSMKQTAEMFPHSYSDVAANFYFRAAKFGIICIADGDQYLHINSAKKQVDMAFDYLNKSNGYYYIPTEILGINSMGDAKDAAKEFLSLYLSTEVQNTNTMGFSINRNSMRNGVRVTDEPQYGTTIYQNMGDTSGMAIDTLSPDEFDELVRFIELADTPAYTDAVVMEAVVEQADKILYEGVDVETAVEQVYEKIDLYLKE